MKSEKFVGVSSCRLVVFRFYWGIGRSIVDVGQLGDGKIIGGSMPFFCVL
jgi:hypothetical protein